MTTNELPEINHFEAWLRELDDVCYEESGLSYRDMPIRDLKSWYEGGMNPKIACFQMMQDLDVADVYYQEFDDFTDADPGL